MSVVSESVVEHVESDILIVGGGVAGSALAAALRNSGYRISMIDQRTSPLDAARGDHFSPANIASFAEWGILDEFIKRGAGKRIGAEYRTSDGEVLFFGEYSEVEMPYPYFLIYHHDLMAETFQEIASANSDFKLFQPFSAKSFEVEGVGIKSVTATSPSGESVKFSAPLVVAADGASSAIRSALKFPTFEHPYRHTFGVMFAKTPPSFSSEYLYRFSDPSGLVVVVGRNEGTMKVAVLVGDEGVPWWKSSSSVQRWEVLAKSAPEFTGLESEVVGFYPVRMIHSLQYVSGNTVLLGDCAHAIHPARGQGLNLGISSIPALIKNLPSPQGLKDPSRVAEALVAYENYQKPRFERVIARNHMAAMDMEMAAGENREFFIKRQDENIRKMAAIPAARTSHFYEASGYPFGLSGEYR